LANFLSVKPVDFFFPFLFFPSFPFETSNTHKSLGEETVNSFSVFRVPTNFPPTNPPPSPSSPFLFAPAGVKGTFFLLSSSGSILPLRDSFLCSGGNPPRFPQFFYSKPPPPFFIRKSLRCPMKDESSFRSTGFFFFLLHFGF